MEHRLVILPNCLLVSIARLLEKIKKEYLHEICTICLKEYNIHTPQQAKKYDLGEIDDSCKLGVLHFYEVWMKDHLLMIWWKWELKTW